MEASVTEALFNLAKEMKMSEKSQGTAASLREKMLLRYNDGLLHKHNKNHHSYRQHWRTHPSVSNLEKYDNELLDGANGLVRQFNLRRVVRKRLDKGRIH
jgi:hypothetical protein